KSSAQPPGSFNSATRLARSLSGVEVWSLSGVEGNSEAKHHHVASATLSHQKSVVPERSRRDVISFLVYSPLSRLLSSPTTHLPARNQVLAGRLLFLLR